MYILLIITINIILIFLGYVHRVTTNNFSYSNDMYICIGATVTSLLLIFLCRLCDDKIQQWRQLSQALNSLIVAN